MTSDKALHRNVEEELSREPRLDAAGINVAANHGIVILCGHVSSYAEAVAAERATARVLGVRAIINELDVMLPGSTRVTDKETARG